MILLPGTKNTMSDLLWMRQNGLEAAVSKAAEGGTVIFGICGGYQMLGQFIHDPQKIENGGSVRGMGLLPVETTFAGQKIRTRVDGTFLQMDGSLERLKGVSFEGYEIHMGETKCVEPRTAKDAAKIRSAGKAECMAGTRSESMSMSEIRDAITGRKSEDGMVKGNVYGTYVHGIFDRDEVAAGIIESLAGKKGIKLRQQKRMDFRQFKETQYDLLAAGLREHMDMEAVYRIMGLA